MKFSIIIPTYNEEKYIEGTLERLTKELTLEHEVIVSDDKSKDSTVALAKRFPVVVLEPEAKHATIAANRNHGARHATGDFFVFLDCDHYLENPNDFFTKALKRFDDDLELMALTGALWVLPDMETWSDWAVYTVFNWVHRVKNNALNVGEASGKFQMIRRSAFEKIGGFRTDLVTREDADMFQRLSKIGKTYCDPDLKVFHTGRRAHAIGWPKLISIWMIESFKFAAVGKSGIKEWKDVR